MKRAKEQFSDGQMSAVVDKKKKRKCPENTEKDFMVRIDKFPRTINEIFVV